MRRRLTAYIYEIVINLSRKDKYIEDAVIQLGYMYPGIALHEIYVADGVIRYDNCDKKKKDIKWYKNSCRIEKTLSTNRHVLPNAKLNNDAIKCHEVLLAECKKHIEEDKRLDHLPNKGPFAIVIRRAPDDHIYVTYDRYLDIFREEPNNAIRIPVAFVPSGFIEDYYHSLNDNKNIVRMMEDNKKSPFVRCVSVTTNS